MKAALLRIVLGAACCLPGVAAAADVPLSLWTSDRYPDGLSFGATMGISFGDYDADGFVDVFASKSGWLWRNLGGVSWELAGDLSLLLPPTERRYGSSFGDYDRDGLPDIGIASRVPVWGDDRMRLLRNLGGGPSFLDVAGDPSVVDVQPHNNAETLCWGDVNGDGHLDLFVPVYPDFMSGPGNFFLFNEGPTGPGGAFRFTERSGPAGLDNPPGSSRPEGAQMVDADGDGDIDLWSNGTLYQNVSSASTPLFHPLPETASGIGLRGSLEEGTMLFDYDLDGDFDVLAAYVVEGVRIWENRGDGTFFAAEADIVDSPMTGLNLGMSAEDWDNDGDVDLTTRSVFRQNMMEEEGRRHFTVAPTSIPSTHRSSATPAWGDWDRDGDLDCALGNWGSDGHLYENTTYTPDTPPGEKRHVRVRVVRDALASARGLETEYGATAEVTVLTGTPSPLRRRKFVASSHGYLNQNEYTLHFALPPGAVPADPTESIRVGVSVDFPGLPAQGTWRVDHDVNPVLGDIDVGWLPPGREVEVHRCGQVVVGGVTHDPLPLATPVLTTTGGGLGLPSADAALAEPTPSPQTDWYAGLAFDTIAAAGPLLLKEILLDGQLDAAPSCGNVVLWDVTDADNPVMVSGAGLGRSTSTRNRRTAIPARYVLEPGRSYRLVAKVTEYRVSDLPASDAVGGLTVGGGVLYRDQSGCNGRRAAGAIVDGARTALAIRFAPAPPSLDPDPVGASLLLEKDASSQTVLRWQEVGAAGYEVGRCTAAGGPCTPVRHATTVAPTHTDGAGSPAPGELLWYAVKAVNACTAALTGTPP